MGKKSLAMEDHSILAARNSPLADELQFVVEPKSCSIIASFCL
jgi:hypothetical protein